jgi:DNA-binding transcriptional MerR regulator
MTKGPPEEQLTAAECAARMGLTVRALRVYERYGLIVPRRTAKNWRIYGIKEIERLNEIIILKDFGLPLSRIARFLAGRETNLDIVLATQAEALSRQRSRIDQTLISIASVRRDLSHGSASIATLTRLTRDLVMEKSPTDETAWRRYQQARPRIEVKLAPALLGDFAGHYRLSDSLVARIEPGSNSVDLVITGQSTLTLVPEAPDKFFCKQIPLQTTFERDSDGSVCALLIHKDGNEHFANRISTSEARLTDEAFAARLALQEPFSQSEAMIRRLISGLVSGKIDVHEMTQQMAQACQDQEGTLSKDIERAGRLVSLNFGGVGPDGHDVYDAVFENCRMQFRIHIDSSGKIDGLWLRPGP